MDPEAVLISFVGRMTNEKGIDLIADLVPDLIGKYPRFQMVICGPIGDPVAHYAATKLIALSNVMSDRLKVKAEFYMFTPEMRFATDFTMCPSRTEPFGYVDVEHAWCASPTIGGLVGGLGKVLHLGSASAHTHTSAKHGCCSKGSRHLLPRARPDGPAAPARAAQGGDCGGDRDAHLSQEDLGGDVSRRAAHDLPRREVERLARGAVHDGTSLRRVDEATRGARLAAELEGAAR